MNEWDAITEKIRAVKDFVCAMYGKKEIPIYWWTASRTVPGKVQAEQRFFSWLSEETGFCYFTTMFKSALEKDEEVNLYNKTLKKLLKF